MSKNAEKFPVTKNGKFFGYADAGQIAANKSLELFDESKAQAVEAAKEVEKAAATAADKEKKVSEAKAAGADPAAVKKGPAGK